MLKLNGLMAATFTPFGKNGEILYDRIPKMADVLVRNKINGVYINGSTGEGISMSVTERIRVLESWLEAIGGRMKVVVHTGALAMDDVRVLSEHAERNRVDAVSIVPPCYWRPGSIRALVEYCKKVASFAPNTPFYYYHAAISGVALPMPEFLETADGKIPTLNGIKFSMPNLYEYQNCLAAADGKYDILYGVDEMFPCALPVGAKGFIGSTYNYTAKLVHKVWQAFDAGDMKKVQLGMRIVCQLVDMLGQYGGIAAGKAMLMTQGIDFGDPRLPLMPLDAETKKHIVDTASKLLVE